MAHWSVVGGPSVGRDFEQDDLALAAELDLPVFEVTNKELNNWDVFARMVRVLCDIEPTEAMRQAHAEISAQQHNPNRERIAPPAELAKEEADVWRQVGYFEPLLQEQVTRWYRERGEPLSPPAE